MDSFFDSDDEWMPQKIELQVNNVKKSKNKVFFIHTNEIWMMNDKF